MRPTMKLRREKDDNPLSGYAPERFQLCNFNENFISLSIDRSSGGK